MEWFFKYIFPPLFIVMFVVVLSIIGFTMYVQYKGATAVMQTLQSGCNPAITQTTKDGVTQYSLECKK